MSLIWREFERKFHTLYREEQKNSATLRAEIKRHRKSESIVSPELLRRVLMPLFWGALFLSVAGKHGSLGVIGAALALWAAGAAFRWGHHWFQQFYASEDLVVLNQLPLTDPQIFRFQLRRYCTSAGWLFWEMMLAYLVLAFVENTEAPALYLLLLAGALQAVLVVALALHLASWVHMVPLGSLGALLRLTAIMLLIFGAQQSDFGAYFTQATEWFLPTGWINYVLFRAPSDPTIYALLIPVFALIYLARYSFNRLRAYYTLAGVEIMPSRNSATVASEEELTAANAGPKAGPTEIEDRILAGYFLQGLNWELSGAIEKFAARSLSARERMVTEFLVAGSPGWTSSLKVSFWIWLVSCAVVLLLGQFGGTIVFFAGYVLVTTSLPLFGGDWRGMRQTSSGSVFLPAFSVYPITFNSIALIFLKVNLIRIAAASPLILSFAALAAFRLGEPPLSGVFLAAKILAVLICLQPLFVLLPISSTTNDSSRRGLLTLLAFVVPVLLVVIGAAFAVFFARSPGIVLLSYAVLILTSALAFVAYRKGYRRGRFDLLTERSRQR